MTATVNAVKKNDNVVVITGRDRGKRGRVLRVVPAKQRVVVEGVNFIKRHTKPNPQKNIKGGIVEREAPLAASNVQLVCPECSAPDARRPAAARQRARGSRVPQVQGSGRQMSRLKDRYQTEVVPALRKEFGYTNVMAVPQASPRSS